MSALDKLINWAKNNNNIDDEDDDYEDGEDGYLDDENDDDEPASRKKSSQKVTSQRSSRNDYEDDDDEEEAAPPKKTSITRPSSFGGKVMPMRSNSKKTEMGGGMEVCVIKPASFDEAQEIVETLLKNRTITLNLEGLDVDVAQRILDFTSGACFAIGGNLQKVSMYIFMITPAAVPISGDVQEANLSAGGISLNPFM